MIQQIISYSPQILIFALLGLIIYKAHKNADSAFNVFDYILDPATRKASISRTGQCLAILTSTWIVAKMSIANTLTVEIFAVYLAALGVSEAWSKFVGAKYSQPTPTKSE